ncbi:MAG: ribonuclease J [Parcubacteria group bacterium]|nr:ribonuclease J [Parcubacteria group bacterium]
MIRKTRKLVSPPSVIEQSAALRFVPLGGLEEIGRNMMFFEYKNEIVIIDMGIQFPEEETPGIDFIIPNVSYLESRKQNIRGVILTHGHYDHIGAIPYLVEKLGNPPIYALALTRAIIEKRQEEFRNAPKLKVFTVNYGDTVKIGKYFEADFFGVAHTIPDTTGVLLKTPVGNMVHFADFRVDYTADGKPEGLDEYERIGKSGIHTFFVDSTNADEPGKSLSEKIVEKNLEELFKTADGRIIIAIFASLLTRIYEIIKIADKLDRKVVLNGRSMKDNVQIAQNLGYMKIKKGLIIPVEEMHKYRDDKLFVITTGAQGEPQAGLMRIVNGEHRQIQLKESDTVIFSASVIPGNERDIQNLKDNLARQGATVYTSQHIDIHASGHAPKDDLKTVIKLVKPKFLMPIHGHYFKRQANGHNGREVGIPKENIKLMDNGQVALFTENSFEITKETVPAFYVMVDGLGVGDVEEVVLRDRRALSQEGMLVVIVTLGKREGRLLKNPDIISRGFIYLRENQEILDEIRKRVKGIIGRLPGYQPINADYLKSLLRDQVGQFLYNKTRRRPIVIPVVIEV